MKIFVWSIFACACAALVGAGLFLVLSTPESVSFNQDQALGEEQRAARQDYTLEVDNLERDFIVYRPASLPVSQEVAVVFMYHGHGGTGEKFYKMSGWKEEADKEGFMAIFPTAMRYHMIRESLSEYTTRWNSYQSGEDDFDPAYPDQALADDVAFTRAMLEFLEDNYAIDSNRIYATGFSNGGNMINRLLAEASDVFAAYANSSSGLSIEAVSTSGDYTPGSYTARPVVSIVGSTDPLLTDSLGVEVFPTGEAIMEDELVRRRFIDGYLQLLSLGDEYTYSEQSRVSEFVFSKTAQGLPAQVKFQFLMTAGMDHIFPNGKNYPLKAAEVYWEFFKDYSL